MNTNYLHFILLALSYAIVFTIAFLLLGEQKPKSHYNLDIIDEHIEISDPTTGVIIYKDSATIFSNPDNLIYKSIILNNR